MSESESIEELLKRLEEGDDDAANQIWQRCYPRLIAYASKKLKGVPLQMADEQDVVVSAFESFFKAAKQKRFPNLNDRDDLWRVLFKLTNWKAINLRRHELRRPVTRESATQPPDRSSAGLHNIPGRMSEEDFAAIMVELLEDKLGTLDDDLCKIAVAMLAGFKLPEIAELLSLTLSMVRRKVAIIRQIWKNHETDTSE